jgi:hypothetical protein
MQVREVHMINVSSGTVNNEEAENDVEEGALVMYMPMPFNIVSVDSQLQQTSSSRPPIRPYSAKHNTPALSRFPLLLLSILGATLLRVQILVPAAMLAHAFPGPSAPRVVPSTTPNI